MMLISLLTGGTILERVILSLSGELLTPKRGEISRHSLLIQGQRLPLKVTGRSILKTPIILTQLMVTLLSITRLPVRLSRVMSRRLTMTSSKNMSRKKTGNHIFKVFLMVTTSVIRKTGPKEESISEPEQLSRLQQSGLMLPLKVKREAEAALSLSGGSVTISIFTASIILLVSTTFMHLPVIQEDLAQQHFQ